MQPLSLRWKLTLLILAASCAIQTTVCISYIAYDVINYRNDALSDLTTLARILAENLPKPLQSADPVSVQRVLTSLSENHSILAGATYRSDGTLFSAFRHGDTPVPQTIRPGMPISQWTEGTSLCLIYPIIEKDDSGALFLRSDLTPLKQQIKRFAGIALGSLALSVLLPALLALWVQRRFFAPILAITRNANQIARNDRIHHLQIPENNRVDEVGELARSVTALVTRIENDNQELHTAWDKLERKALDRSHELREVQDRNRQYLDTVGSILVALDRDGVVTFINRRGCEILGYPEDEILGKNWIELVIPLENREEVRNVLRLLLAGNVDPVEKIESAVLTREKIHRQIAWENAVTLDRAGVIQGTFSSGQDITEQQNAKALMIRAQKLESIGTFAGGIAHDFNNYLMAFQGNIELAQLNIDDKEQTLSLLDDALAAAERARLLTRRLLTFSKGSAPKLRTVNIAELVHDATLFVLSGSNVQPKFVIPDDLWHVNVDTGQIEQVITNLVINARQAMPEGGSLAVSLSNVQPDEAFQVGLPKKKFIEIAVHDKGCGIPEALLPRIFDPCFTTKKDGNGLGLATSHTIISGHGGHITVESVVQVGTVFHVYLPAAHHTASEEHESASIVRFATPFRVLLLDDDTSVAKVICTSLEQMGCIAEHTNTGIEAVALYKRRKLEGLPFNIAILDLFLAVGIDGKETASLILKFDPHALLIASSAYANNELMIQYHEHGFCARLPKPYGRAELSATLHEILDVPAHEKGRRTQDSQ